MAEIISTRERIKPKSSGEDGEYFRKLPYNIEAEQALLGAILIDNEALFKISDFLLYEHFFWEVHQEIYAAVQNLMERGMKADPVTLKSRFEGHEALEDLGGAGYLARLTGFATGIVNVTDYGRSVYELAMSRGLIRLGHEIVEDAYDKSLEIAPSEQIEKAEQSLFSLASEGNSDKNFSPLNMALADAIARAEFALKMKGQVSGITTGYTDMNRMLGGFHDSDLVILAGRPSMGKTALAVNLAYNAAKSMLDEYKAGDEVDPKKMKSVGVFSLEMSAEQIGARLLSMETGISSGDIRRGKLDDKKGEFEKLVKANKDLYELPLYIDDTPALSISAIRTRARRLKRKHNLKLLVVDYLQLIHGSINSSSQHNRVQEISEVTQGLKAIAKELDIPVLALSQLSRAVEQRDDKRPLLSDLRESGSIEQDADIVMFIYREQYYLERTRPADGSEELATWMEKNGERWMHSKNKAEVIISKHRNGPIGNIFMMFNASTTHFRDLEEKYSETEAPF